MTGPLIATTSWDDGYTADRKLADVLADCGASGTFYVPTRNSEGRPVLSPADVRDIATRFEVGGHSRDHVVLTDLSQSELDTQIFENKAYLEQAVGAPIAGFCYVRGRYNGAVKNTVARAGYRYARTVENFRTDMSGDTYEVPTTLQFFDHSRLAQLKTFRHGALSAARVRMLFRALPAADIASRVDRLAVATREAGGIFHLWGHSWELEEYDLWGALRETLRNLVERHNARIVTNAEAVATMQARQAPRP